MTVSVLMLCGCCSRVQLVRTLAVDAVWGTVVLEVLTSSWSTAMSAFSNAAQIAGAQTAVDPGTEDGWRENLSNALAVLSVCGGGLFSFHIGCTAKLKGEQVISRSHSPSCVHILTSFTARFYLCEY